jgi:hypothetical protein
MNNQQSRSVERGAGSFLLLSVVAVVVGSVMFFLRGGMTTDIPTTPSPNYTWERGFILAAAVLAAIGFMLLEMRLQDSGGRVLARTGAVAYLFGGILVAVAEALDVSQGHTLTHMLIAVYVILALLAQAAIGGALVQSRLLPAWIGWAAIGWNVLWLVVLPLTSAGDMYYPILHHVAPLVIGIASLRK